jgi:hypothetical protein
VSRETELRRISLTAYVLQEVARPLYIIAPILLAASWALVVIQLLQGSSVPVIWLAIIALPSGGCLTALGCLLDSVAEWLIHRKGLTHSYAEQAYVPRTSATFPYLEQVRLLVLSFLRFTFLPLWLPLQLWYEKRTMH